MDLEIFHNISLRFVSRFRIDNTDHIIDVNQHGYGRSAHEYDQVNIICPKYDRNLVQDENATERFVIYHVTKEEYDSCRIFGRRPHIIAQCNSPFQKLFFTISFRSFSPTPGALEFKPGFDYHFISTSSKENINQLENGMCHTHNMKLVFKVADKPRKRTFPQKSYTKNHKNVQNEHNDGDTKNKQSDSKNGWFAGSIKFNKGTSLIRKQNEYPKSLDYFLYQNKGKKKQLDGPFKQEASTSNTIPSLKYSVGLTNLLIFMSVLTFACSLLFE